jgi:hypothetical protein
MQRKPLFHNPVKSRPTYFDGLWDRCRQSGNDRIQKAPYNPVTHARFGKSLKRDVTLFYECLFTLAVKEDQRPFYSAMYHRTMQYRTGEVRLSYDDIAFRFFNQFGIDISVDTCQRYCRILEALGCIYVITEAKIQPTQTERSGLMSSAELKQLVDSRALYANKYLMLNFDLLEDWYEHMNRELDRELTKVNEAPEAPEYLDAPDYIQNLLESEPPEILDPEPYSIDIPDFENEPLLCETSQEICGAVLGDTEILNTRDNITQVYATVPQISGTSFPEGKPEVVPSPDSDWEILVADGSVARDRDRKLLSDVPAQPKGEYYATWIAYRGDQFWAPWVLWDIDQSDKNLDKAADRTYRLVAKLQRMGVPEACIRVVFSTSKGFHVYLDSRAVGIKPSKNLHLILRELCASIAGSDPTAYSKNRIVGVPNSKHRETGWRYAYVPLEMLERAAKSKAAWSEIMMRTAGYSEPLPKPKSVEVCADLAEYYRRAVAKAMPEPQGFISFGRVQQIATQPLPEFYGVGEGERDRAVWKLANYYRRNGQPKDEAMALCLVANSRNRPPLPDEEVKVKVNRVFEISIARENLV